MHAANDDVEDNQVRAELTRSFAILLDPDVHERAQTWADDPAGYAGTLDVAQLSHVRTSRILKHRVRPHLTGLPDSLD